MIVLDISPLDRDETVSLVGLLKNGAWAIR